MRQFMLGVLTGSSMLLLIISALVAWGFIFGRHLSVNRDSMTFPLGVLAGAVAVGLTGFCILVFLVERAK